MFTGLIQGLGTVAQARHSSAGVRLTVDCEISRELSQGDSVAVNGVCLTATEVGPGSFDAEVMHETLARSALREATGAPVNLELPLRAGDRLGGHVVQGHVDGVGTVGTVAADGFAQRLRIQAPGDVLRYVVRQGSVAVDGVSLTVADVDDASFTVSLIPETLQRTNLGTARAGTLVNLEVDVLAKYVEKLVGAIR